MRHKVLKKVYIVLLLCAFAAFCLPVSASASASVANPILGLPFALNAYGLGGEITTGSVHGVYGGLAVLYPENTPAISAITISSGGGVHMDTGLRSYGYTYRVTFAESFSTSAYPCFALAFDPSLLFYLDGVSFYADGVQYDYNINDNLLLNINGNGTFYTVTNSGTLDSSYNLTFENKSFICFSLPAGVTTDNIRVGITFSYYRVRPNYDLQPDIADRLMWPFQQAGTSTVLQNLAVISENNFMKPYIYGGIFLLIAGMVGKFVL